MLAPIYVCWFCDGEFEPIEGTAPSAEEPQFCTSACEESWLNEQAYEEARYGSAPVFE